MEANSTTVSDMDQLTTGWLELPRRHKQHQSVFLRIPPDVRNRIVSLVIPEIEVLVAGVGRLPSQYVLGHYRGAAAAGTTSQASIGLLLVCCQLYEEFSGLIYEKTAFAFKDRGTFDEFSRRTPPLLLKAIKRLSLLRTFPHDDTEAAVRSIKGEERWVHSYKHNLPLYTGLQHLGLYANFEDWPLFHPGSLEQVWVEKWQQNITRPVSHAVVVITSTDKVDDEAEKALQAKTDELAKSVMGSNEPTRQDTGRGLIPTKEVDFTEFVTLNETTLSRRRVPRFLTKIRGHRTDRSLARLGRFKAETSAFRKLLSRHHYDSDGVWIESDDEEVRDWWGEEN